MYTHIHIQPCIHIYIYSYIYICNRQCWMRDPSRNLVARACFGSTMKALQRYGLPGLAVSLFSYKAKSARGQGGPAQMPGPARMQVPGDET